MYKEIPVKYTSKTFPLSPTVDLKIDTEMWCFGIMLYKYNDMICCAKTIQIIFLCFTIRFRRFFSDMNKE